MPVDFIQPTIIFVIAVVLLSSGVVPAFYFMNRLFRDEPVKWDRKKAVGFMLFIVTVAAGALTINSLSVFSGNMSIRTAVASFVFAIGVCLIVVVLLGMVFAYPLHRWIEWQEPPEIIQKYES